MNIFTATVGSIALAMAGLVGLLVSEQANAEYAMSDLRTRHAAS